MKVFKLFASIFAWVVVGLLFVVLLVNIIDRSTQYRAPLFGFRPTAVVTESMQTVNEANDYIDPSWDRINKGDVVVTQVTSYDSLQQYDVITYINSNGILICHRIIDFYEEGGTRYVITRGDANNTNDSPVKEEALRGKVVSIWRGVGNIVSFVTSLYFLLAVFMSLFFVAGGYVVYYILKNKKGKEGQIKNEK